MSVQDGRSYAMNTMSARFFIDTNIFVYSFDSRNPTKQKKAQNLIETALTEQTGFISSQVIQEFLNVALRKFETPLSRHEAKTYLEDVLLPLCEVYPTADIYTAALDIREEATIGFYDALMIASAEMGEAKIFYSEDLQAGRRLAGLTIRNPFAKE
jgi:predicted nucleic acid-binding protein